MFLSFFCVSVVVLGQSETLVWTCHFYSERLSGLTVFILDSVHKKLRANDCGEQLDKVADTPEHCSGQTVSYEFTQSVMSVRLMQ